MIQTLSATTACELPPDLIEALAEAWSEVLAAEVEQSLRSDPGGDTTVEAADAA